jgi:hypothetical protein
MDDSVLGRNIDETKKERVLDLVGDHWIGLWLPISFYVTGWLLAGVVYLLSQALTLTWPIANEISFLMILAGLLISHHWFFIFLLHREVGCWVITEKRVISFEFFPYVMHDTNYIEISDLREVRKESHGVLSTLLDYGEVHLITVGGSDVMRLKYVPQPSRFVNLIESVRNATLSP